MNYLDLSVEVMSTIALHLTLNISKTIIDSLGSKGPPIGNGICGMGFQMVT